VTHALPIGTALGRLQLLEVYDLYDGPRLFSAVSATGAAYLAFWVGEHEEADDWLYVAISMRRLDEVVEGAVPLRSAFTEPEDGFLFFVETRFDGSPSTASARSPSEVEDSILPLADDRLRGQRLRATDDEQLAAAVPQQLMQGRVRQRLKLERRGKRPVAFDAVMACLSRWQVLFSTAFEAAGGTGALIPVFGAPGSFKLTLTLPKGRPSTQAFESVRHFVERIDAGGKIELNPDKMNVDVREFESLVATLREHELMLTIEQESAGHDDLAPVVLDLRVDAPVATRARDAAVQVLDSGEIPQADDLDRALLLVTLLGRNRSVTPKSLDVVERQVNYYKQACRILRLLDDDNQLTSVGEQVLALADRETRLSALAVQFETSRCGWRWVQWSKGKSLLDVKPTTAEAFLVSSAPVLSASTAKRRARTLETWCGVLQPQHFLRRLREGAS
jgi:hypothetical protein